MALTWKIKSFSTLTPKELYSIMQLRQEVFVIEQACIYQDADGWDEQALHLFCLDGQQICAYSRLFLAGVKYPQASIGRVVVATSHRKTGLGRILFAEGVRYLTKEYQQQTIYLQAQAYLESFYASFGFQTISKPYLEDDILHVDMLKQEEN
ncbi:GNAT family N-acetyltransferase [Enterococcus bulliens]